MAISIPRGTFIWITLFIVLTLPFVLAFLPQQYSETSFSIYNTGWDGYSQFASLIEHPTTGSNVSAKIQTIVGSDNALNRLNSTGGADSGALIIAGPKVPYDPTEAIAILLYFLKGGRIVIMDDYGTANDILYYFSLILNAISSVNLPTQGTNTTNPFGIGTSSTGNIDLKIVKSSNESISNQIFYQKLHLPSYMDPLLPYLAPSSPVGSYLWQLTHPSLQSIVLNPRSIGIRNSIDAISQTGVNSNLLAAAGFNILQAVVGIAINQSVLVDTQNYVNSPVQPLLEPPVNDPTIGSLVAPWITTWTSDVSNGVVANYASILSMKIKYPTNFTNINNSTDIINYDAWSALALTNPQLASQYKVSQFATQWVPFGDFPVQIPAIQGISSSLLSQLQPKFHLAALYSSQKSFLDSNVTAAKNVNTIVPSASEWGNVQFPVATIIPIGFSADSPQLYLISDPSIFINQYVSQTPTGSFNPQLYSNRQFAINTIQMLLGDRPGATVYFDEGHLAQSYTSPTLYMGLFFRFLDALTMFPLIAPLIPITILGLARRYAPKGRKAAAPLLMTKIEQYRGRSYFAYKMRWLLDYQNYSKGLALIYRRVKRDVIKRYNLEEWSAEIAYTKLSIEFPQNIKGGLLRKFVEIENVVSKDSSMSEGQFMEYYLALKDVTDLIKSK